MCMNCGCGDADKRHHPTDITREDLQRAADGAGMTLRNAAANVQQASDKLARTNDEVPASSSAT